ncbi:maleylpyruvate isomerase family mycothiol-dependent enzyme [Salinibacterium sp. SYSU T00001]|uniref:maleylpyruvate isomerase family mycothiol-dependent enzyme n=1 Tax=Homoserinimonas sedimenticola TaxID=2986805 RepID=UPI0022366FFD|nr:maleylpyruvate isomerase family mycothiol-dependent enzyme [Salinibacterium sedimenticola]MCW4384865.1 maleylpyruvate isomerase family mycothiol-dependent enzyme [Salinibacterium sedimenticola]
MRDQQRLAGYVAVARRTIDDFVALLEQLPDAAWSQPTDLPGWSVHDIAAHTAHLESVLATLPDARAEPTASASLPAPPKEFTESGVAERRSRTPREIIAEIRESSAARFAALEAEPPTDASARPRLGVPGLDWTWETLLRNRPLDVWMHEQDIRRAVGLPGGLDAPGAIHTATYFAESLGYVIAKRAGAAPGATVVFELAGLPVVAFGVGDDGRGRPLAEIPEQPTVRIRTDLESYIALAGGRRAPLEGAVAIEGDEELAERILANLTMTA